MSASTLGLGAHALRTQQPQYQQQRVADGYWLLAPPVLVPPLQHNLTEPTATGICAGALPAFPGSGSLSHSQVDPEA